MIFMILIFSKEVAGRKSYIVIVHYTGDTTGDAILKTLGKRKYSVRSKIFRSEDMEMTLQVNCKEDNLVFAEKIRSLETVKDVAVLEFNGEYHG